MKITSIVILVLFTAWAAAPKTAGAQTAVSIELVLAVDSSASVNDLEFELQMRGIAYAFRTPDVMRLIESMDGVAVTLIQWSSWSDRDQTLPWRLLHDRASILSFADEVEATSRSAVGNLTAIGTVIQDSLKAIAENEFAGWQRKIDVSGDGQNNAGFPLEEARRQARSMGVTVNALAIETDYADLAGYFRDQIITGPGAFVLAAADYEDFPRAMQVKLLRELATTVSQAQPLPRNARKRSQR